MTDFGYIYLHRKLKEKGYYKDSNCVALWVHLLLSVNFEEKEFMWNGQLIKIKPGQMLTGRRSLSKDTGINQYKIERILKLFENEHQIAQQTFNKFRIITIVNWKPHQVGGEKCTTKCTTGAQQMHTNNNDNKEKNNTIKKVVSFFAGKITEIKGADYKPMLSWGKIGKRVNELLEDFTEDEIMEMIDYYFDDGKKGSMFGYELLTILSNHSVNQWQDYAKAK